MNPNRFKNLTKIRVNIHYKILFTKANVVESTMFPLKIILVFSDQLPANSWFKFSWLNKKSSQDNVASMSRLKNLFPLTKFESQKSN